MTDSSRLPLVTALAICYNHERFVSECLEGIRAQDYPNLQVIIMDDCSRDSSPALIREWIAKNPALPVEFVHNERNLGVCKVLNQALDLAKGKYLSLTATDDVWLAGKIRQQVEIMESLPEKVGVLYSDAYQIDEFGALVPRRFIESYREFDQMPEGDIHDLLWERNFIPGMTTLVRRSVFDKVGQYDESLFYEDWDMWLRVSEHYDFTYSPTPAAKYRIVQTSMSKSSVDKMTLANELMFIKYLLRKKVPKRMQSQAFNFAVRRAFRERQENPKQTAELLNTLVRLYKAPRLLYAWLLYRWGSDYCHYERGVELVKTLLIRGKRAPAPT
jgi:glycosyltransferase involved in cell wall biosynthesis